MSNTPETDKQAMQMPMKADAQSPSGWCSVVRTSFAREQEKTISRLRADNAALRGALRPFSHDDLCDQLGGNVQGDYSPVFARNKAMLTLGDFRKARAVLVAGGGK